MAASSEPSSPHDTRLRLIEAAGNVFGAHGFEQATVRDICSRADANVASVKYHFGGKTELYGATMRHYAQAAFEKYPPEMDLPPDPAPVDRLRAYIRGSIYRILDEGPESVHGRLMAWEMIRPTRALDEHVEAIIRPMSDRLRKIVTDLNPALREQEVQACMGSIIGQVLFYKHCRPVMDKLFPGQPCGVGNFEALAEHITQFSLHGMGIAVD